MLIIRSCDSSAGDGSEALDSEQQNIKKTNNRVLQQLDHMSTAVGALVFPAEKERWQQRPISKIRSVCVSVSQYCTRNVELRKTVKFESINHIRGKKHQNLRFG